MLHRDATWRLLPRASWARAVWCMGQEFSHRPIFPPRGSPAPGTRDANGCTMAEERTCPNCGGAIGDTDTVCPHCDEPLVGG